MRHLISLAAASLLLVGVTACGTSQDLGSGSPAPANTTSPSASPSAAPATTAPATPADKASCDALSGPVLFVRLRIVGVAVRIQTSADINKEIKEVKLDLTDKAKDIDKALSAATDARVKTELAVIKTELGKLVAALNAYTSDRDKLNTDVRKAADAAKAAADRVRILCPNN